MELEEKDCVKLRQKFQKCRKIFWAIGDEVKQDILLGIVDGKCGGNRVIDIAQKINLSRPAVSRHMQELADAGILKTRKEGTYIYYYIDPSAFDLDFLIEIFQDMKKVLGELPDRSGSGSSSENLESK